MTRALRSVAGGCADLGRYVWRTGRWWQPLLLVVLGAVVALAAATQTVVPTAVYTLF